MLFQISSMCGLTEDSWILITAFAYNLLQYVADGDNSVSQIYVAKRWKSILIDFSDNCGDFSLVLHQNLTSSIS